MAKALKTFTQEKNRLPVQGTIPDMISTTDYYIKLQQIYLDKSSQDQAELRQIVDRYLQEINSPDPVMEPISEEALTMFVRSCHQINVLKMSTLRKE